MELAITSETKLEYAREMHMLKHYIDNTAISLHNNFIKDPGEKISQDLKRKKERLSLLREETASFEVDALLPSGGELKESIPHVTWLGRVRAVDYKEYHDSIICSACCFSLGLETLAENGDIPCGAIHGSVRKLEKSYKCALVTFNCMTIKGLYSKISQECGEEALQRFQKKEAELKTQNPK